LRTSRAVGTGVLQTLEQQVTKIELVINLKTASLYHARSRQRRLDAIGFIWDPLLSDWERAFAALKSFRAREGHYRVPAGHIEGKFKLGQWASGQRSKRNIMPAERRQRLDAIGFAWSTKELHRKPAD
jgi:hypothetical protein